MRLPPVCIAVFVILFATSCSTTVEQERRPRTETTAHAATQPDGPRKSLLFEETFDDENGGEDALNYTGFGRWRVEEGAVDLVGVRFNLLPRRGMYVDMDGSTGQPGRLVSRTPIELTPGRYELSFDLAGSQREDGKNAVVVSVGRVFREQFELGQDEPARTITRVFAVEELRNARISFGPPVRGGRAGGRSEGASGESAPMMPEPPGEENDEESEQYSPTRSDNMGLLLDNVRLIKKSAGE